MKGEKVRKQTKRPFETGTRPNRDPVFNNKVTLRPRGKEKKWKSLLCITSSFCIPIGRETFLATLDVKKLAFCSGLNNGMLCCMLVLQGNKNQQHCTKQDSQGNQRKASLGTWTKIYLTSNGHYWLKMLKFGRYCIDGGVAQMVERSLSMREVPGSIPGASKIFFLLFCLNSKVSYFFSIFYGKEI